HWLGLSLAGKGTNKNGIGARVTVIDTSNRKQIFDISTAGSYLSSNDPRVLVGLGPVTEVRSVEVRWLGGKTQTLTNLTIDRYHVIPER
ncbi:MAG: ASPIC/UnbV domain-containing protein, partial [Acidobacteria bacterium]|nr:ASPIC/UnbV domain-containing protein [Acidobacteriota bacterium]